MDRPAVKDDPLGYFKWWYAGGTTDMDKLRERWHDDLVIVRSPKIFGGGEGEFRGFEGLQEMFTRLDQLGPEIVFHPQKVVELGDDRYLVLHRAEGTTKASEMPLDMEVAHVMTIRDEKAARMEPIIGWDKALAAVGREGEDPS
jgi:ketosteroid isomerase-like protein